MNISDCVKVLQSSRGVIKKYLQDNLKNGNYSYRNFGTAVEPAVTNILVEIFQKAGIIRNQEDYRIAKDKNEFPDFTLLSSDPPLAIEFKSGNRCQLKVNKWVTCRNSENDMGTINEWPRKLKKFGGENIYYLFIEYNFTDQVQEIVDVKIAPFYEFLDLNSDGLLRYREKDGNLRPKNFDTDPPINSLEQFQKLIPVTAVYRSKRIIIKHLGQLSPEQRLEFLRELASQEGFDFVRKK